MITPGFDREDDMKEALFYEKLETRRYIASCVVTTVRSVMEKEASVEFARIRMERSTPSSMDFPAHIM